MHARAWQFADLAYWHKGGAEPEGDHGPQEESASIESDDNVDLSVGRGGYNVGGEMMNKVCNECLEG